MSARARERERERERECYDTYLPVAFEHLPAKGFGDAAVLVHGPLVLRDGLLEDLGPLGGVWHSVGVNPDDGALLDVVPALAGWVLHHNLHVVPVHRSLPALHHGRLVEALQEIALRVEERLGGLEVVLTVDAVDDWWRPQRKNERSEARG